MSGASHHVRDLSQVFFGQRYRLELMAAIAESDGLFCLSDLVGRLGVTASNLQGPLKALTEAQLLDRMPSGDSKRRYYRRRDSLAWQFALEMRAMADATLFSSSRPY